VIQTALQNEAPRRMGGRAGGIPTARTSNVIGYYYNLLDARL